MHLSFFKDDFREFVDTLVAALRQIEKAESHIKHIHPVLDKPPPIKHAGREGHVYDPPELLSVQARFDDIYNRGKAIPVA